MTGVLGLGQNMIISHTLRAKSAVEKSNSRVLQVEVKLCKTCSTNLHATTTALCIYEEIYKLSCI